MFDEEDWTLRLQMKCIDEKNNEICNLNCDRLISKSDKNSFIHDFCLENHINYNVLLNLIEVRDGM